MAMRGHRPDQRCGTSRPIHSLDHGSIHVAHLSWPIVSSVVQRPNRHHLGPWVEEAVPQRDPMGADRDVLPRSGVDV
jgi:hypothetical protein